MNTMAAVSQRLSIERWIPWLLALSLLAIPISSTAKSICLGLSLAAILLAPAYQAQLLSLFSSSWGRASLLLFGLALIACLWSPATYTDKLFVIEKYSKFLYLPILAAGFASAKTRNLAIHAFLLAMLITASLAVLKFNGFLPFLDINPDRVFRNHIMSGLMAAFAAYLAALFVYRQQGIACWAYGLLFLLLSYYTLFVNHGRAGYVIYFLLVSLLILQLCSWRKAALGVAIVCATCVLVYTQNSQMKERVNLALTEFKEYRHNNKTTAAVGMRLQFYTFAEKLFKKHPIIGNGTASFMHYATEENPVPEWGSWHRLLEPHSQYWLALAEFGIVGLSALLLFFASLLKSSWALENMRPIALAMLFAFLVGNATDSLLFYSGSGYFFILVMALCLGESAERARKLPAGL